MAHFIPFHLLHSFIITGSLRSKITSLAFISLAIVGVNAESHTITFDNRCGFGTPHLLQATTSVSTGEDFTVDGPFTSGFAFLQTGDCGTNGENCMLIEITLMNPNSITAGLASSADITLISPHSFNVPAGFAFFNGCDGVGQACSNPSCPSAFHSPSDNQVVTVCQSKDVNLAIIFCPDGKGVSTTASASITDIGSNTRSTNPTNTIEPGPNTSSAQSIITGDGVTDSHTTQTDSGANGDSAIPSQTESGNNVRTSISTDSSGNSSAELTTGNPTQTRSGFDGSTTVLELTDAVGHTIYSTETFSNLASTNSVDLNQQSQGNRQDTAVIAGSVVGGIVGLALLLLIAFLCLRRQMHQENQQLTKPVEPYDLKPEINFPIAESPAYTSPTQYPNQKSQHKQQSLISMEEALSPILSGSPAPTSQSMPMPTERQIQLQSQADDLRDQVSQLGSASITSIAEVSEMQATIDRLMAHIRMLESQLTSDWAMGLTDDPPPIYTVM
ncbi:hypothetical protein VKT23_010147 [Stygiomarasmius scandens]|uniref:Epidermal growth factor receptor-like transmembrane-juxtamembrane segment domain-containing protein n=1 Tax=Marasmiellus scandens TaxID=2682957 RepID=A0ABR1JC71_9AGAR